MVYSWTATGSGHLRLPQRARRRSARVRGKLRQGGGARGERHLHGALFRDSRLVLGEPGQEAGDDHLEHRRLLYGRTGVQGQRQLVPSAGRYSPERRYRGNATTKTRTSLRVFALHLRQSSIHVPLTAGTRIGSYQIIASLGAGGMGEVYRARDTRLDRQVAIKVLPDAGAGDADRLARFEREAKMLATLNHPLIAQVYGFEQSGGTHAIVMELVEGPTLEERIAQGPIPIPDALHIARQMTEALEAAHDLGIIHRDLKPANIKLLLRGARPRTAGPLERGPADVDDCTVKVLDFGLAKIVDQTASADPLSSPTLTARATALGTILGTAAYMAPEQARGRIVDKRADVWAFGVVLYEMLTGTRLFKSEDVSDTLAAVLRQPIAFAALPDGDAGCRPRAARALPRARPATASARHWRGPDFARADSREPGGIRDRRWQRPRTRGARAHHAPAVAALRGRSRDARGGAPCGAVLVPRHPSRRPSRRHACQRQHRRPRFSRDGRRSGGRPLAGRPCDRPARSSRKHDAALRAPPR